MHYRTFDTHKYIKSLQETGFNEKQAEMLVKSLLESRDFDLSILATREQVSEVKKEIAQLDNKLSKEIAEVKIEISEVKSDLQKEITEVKNEIIQLDTKLSKEISSIKYDILKWFIPMFIALLVAIFLKR